MNAKKRLVYELWEVNDAGLIRDALSECDKFIKWLYFELHFLFLQITSAGRRFNKLKDFAKKLKGVRRDSHAKALAKRDKN